MAKYIFDIDKCKDLPVGEGYLCRDGKYCAMGHIYKGIGAEDKEIENLNWGPSSIDDGVAISFLVDLTRLGFRERFIRTVNINDMEHNFEKAFRYALNVVLESGLVEMKLDKEFQITSTGLKEVISV